VVEFRVLGDVEARVDGQLLDMGHARQRCVLATLLVEANHAVSADQLIDRVWGERLPPRARNTLYSYLSRLRHALAAVDGVDLTRQSGGYVLKVDPMAVDLHRFHHLVTRARAAQSEDRALSLFERALGLWQGEAFATLDTAWLNARRDALERERLAVELDRNDLQLRCGQHAWLLAGLSAHTAAHPLDERLAGQLMLALYRCGRQADALEHFHQMRLRLAEELGVDPGPPLQRLYEQILTTDPALTVPTVTRSAPASAEPPVPRQLPAHTPCFVGRAEELRQLTALLDTTPHSGGTVMISAIDGTAGIGKTALAVHWAHRIAERFPDGQLYVNLRGFDPTGAPMQPAVVLRGFLDAFEIPPERIPVSLDAQAALYRSLLADRHVLVVLDNTRDTEQVRPLLPGSPTCLVVITSRQQLTSLVAQEGARLVTLDALSPEEATALLTRHLGHDRVAVESDAVAELIEHCARLPLALAIAVARAAAHPNFPLRVLAEELRDEQTRLDALDAGDSATSVRAVFSWSYQHLDAAVARMFRLLGLHPGPDISLSAIASLADVSLRGAREALGELTRAHLLAQPTPGRFTFHDLLRAYATQLAATEDPETERRAALTRLFDHYLVTAAAAMNTLHPAEAHRRPRIRPSATPSPPVTEPDAAQAWLDTERVALTAACAYTIAHGWPGHTTGLSTILFRYLEVGGHYPDAVAIHSYALHAAHHSGDRAAEAQALTSLGVVYWQQGRYERAVDHHQQALVLFREIGHRSGEAHALSNVGLVYSRQGYYERAVDHHQQALVLFREIGHRDGEAHALDKLGLVYRRQGYYERAVDHHQQALVLFREIGHRSGEAHALDNLGLVYRQQGYYERAVDHHQQALVLFRQIGHRSGEADALDNLGHVYFQQGRYPQAADHHQQALALCREIGHRDGEANALDNLGHVHFRQGYYPLAVDHHQQALALCREIGYRAGEADVLASLGFVYFRQGYYPLAVDHHQQALALFCEMGYRGGEAKALNGVGETHRAIGQLREAHIQHTAALTLATQIGDRYEQARAHNGLAHTHYGACELDQARHHWRHALTVYTDLGVPDAEDIQAHLTALDHHNGD